MGRDSRTRMPSLFIFFALSACGEASVIDSTAASPSQIRHLGSDSGRNPRLEKSAAVQPPPHAYYQHIFASIFAKIDRKAYTLKTNESPHIFWMRYDGATVRQGFAYGESYLVCDQKAVVPPSELSKSEQQEVTQAAKAQFEKLGIKTRFTTQKPSETEYNTIIIGGKASDLGCSDNSLLGLAPFDRADANKADLLFVFDQSIMQLEGAKISDVSRQLTAQLGRAIGIQDISTYVPLRLHEPAKGLAKDDIGGLSLADSATTSSKNPFTKLPAHLLSLPGLSEIATIAQLLPELPAQSHVIIDHLLPSIGRLFPAGYESSPLNGLEKPLTIISRIGDHLHQAPKISSNYAPSPSETSALTDADRTASIQQAAAAPTNNSDSLQKGLETAKDIIDIFSDLIRQPQTPAPSPTSPPTPAPLPTGQPSPPQPQPPQPPARLDSLPNLPVVLDLISGNNSQLPAILNNFAGSAQAITGSLTGDEYEAMIALIKVAYAQAWQKSSPKP